jgi:hypothetical protein
MTSTTIKNFEELFTSDDDADEIQSYMIVHKLTSNSIKLNFEKLVKFVYEEKQGYEVLLGKCIPYYDYEKFYDSKEDQEENNDIDYNLARETIMDAYEKTYPNIVIYSFDSSGLDLKGRWKNSFHFRLRKCGYLNQGSDCLLLIGFDKNVYKATGKRQLIRLPLCSKEDEDRPLSVRDSDKTYNEDWLISYTDTENDICKVKNDNSLKVIKPIIKKKITRIYTVNEIESLFDCIDYEDMSDDWVDWTKMLWGLRNMSDDYGIDLRFLAHTVSKCSDKYDEFETDKMYDAKDKNPSNNPIGIATFVKMAKTKNPELFMAWRKSKPDKSNCSIVISQSEIQRNVSNMITAISVIDDNMAVPIVEDMIVSTTPITLNKVIINNTFDFTNNYDFSNFHTEYNGKYYDEVENDIINKYPSVIAHVLIGKGCYIKKLTDGAFDIVDVLGTSELIFTTDTPKNIKLSKFMSLKPTSFRDIRCVLNHSSCPINSFNIWSGFQSKIVDVKEPSEGFTLMCKSIMEIWANDNVEHYNYIISWLSGLVNINNINKIALLMISPPGCGKGTLIEFLEYILRKINIVSVVGINKIVAKFNTLLQGKRLICINEMSSTKDEFRSNFDKMKSYITDPTIIIEPKGVNSFSVDNISNFIMFSNHIDSVIVEQQDRRYAIFEMSTKYINNWDYFGNIRNKCFNQEVADEFYTYLMNFKTVPIHKIPNTDLRKELINLSKANPIKFIDFVRDDPDSMERLTNKVKGIVLYTEYKKWCVDNGERCYSNTKFGITISTVLQKLRSNGVYYIL